MAALHKNMIDRETTAIDLCACTMLVMITPESKRAA